MSELTDEGKKALERLLEADKEPRKPLTTPNIKKFTDNVLVPASEYRDWREVLDKGNRRPPKETRRQGKQPPKK